MCVCVQALRLKKDRARQERLDREEEAKQVREYAVQKPSRYVSTKVHYRSTSKAQCSIGPGVSGTHNREPAPPPPRARTHVHKIPSLYRALSNHASETSRG